MFQSKVLEVYIDKKLVDSCLLSLDRMHDPKERQANIQGAINEQLEKWSDSIKDQEREPEFFIKGNFCLKNYVCKG